jgi:prephenate dehydrogenase
VKKLVILGVGLLGGSIGLTARKRKLAEEVWGFGRDAKRLEAARKKGVLTHATTDLAKACAQADLIVLCTPFTLFEPLLKRISRLAPADCLITDVGSVKGDWCARWEHAALPLRFIGSHPMAGSEKTGWEHASDELFEGAPCIVTPTRTSSTGALLKILGFWTSLGCRMQACSPKRHDLLVGRFSHLTHAMAFALSKSASRGLARKDFSLAGPSYWGNTRIASADAGLWADIFGYNRKVVHAEIDAAIAALRHLKSLKGRALRLELERISKSARQARP